MRTVLSVSLPEKVASELAEYSQQTGRNKSDVMKEALTNYLWEERFKKTKRGLARKAKKAGIVTEEDVFKAVS
jgi:metal-responsive CopG/Arc/MetJ family transcriptional regulator